ncbi:MAG: heme exporter protein CcmB [Bacteroidetes bacterium]|nr:heme exporter protein CcmB [Bacteroidota bacterium]
MSKFLTLIKYQLQAEWRQRLAINGILLHVASSVFLIQLCIKVMNPPTWNALFWILLVFSAITAVGRSFIQETKGKTLYIYTIASPQHYILSKMAYNALLMVVVSIMSLVFYSLFNGFPVVYIFRYSLIIILTSVGYAAVLTMMSAIASKAGNGYLLMPLLSFPVVLPLLLIAIKSSKKAMDGIDSNMLFQDMGLLFVLNIFIATLAYFLFPFLWKD